MSDSQLAFGTFLREARISRRIGLRRFASRIGISPTYLSRVETGKDAPPSEEKIRAIARELEIDADFLLGLAGRVSRDVLEAILERPVAMARHVRNVQESSRAFRRAWDDSDDPDARKALLESAGIREVFADWADFYLTFLVPPHDLDMLMTRFPASGDKPERFVILPIIFASPANYQGEDGGVDDASHQDANNS
jgi:HTH-type transcriptional regulator, competence development regulator